MEVHVEGLAHGIRDSLDLMKQAARSCVINISSIAATRGSRRPQLAYTAAKAGAEALVRECGIYLASSGIRFINVAPGPVDSPLLDRFWSGPTKGDLEAIPMERTGSANEIAELVKALVGPAGAYITAATIAVDGGLSSCNPC